MFKRKVFGIGKIRGVDFTKELLSELFLGKKSEAVFAHSSEYSQLEDQVKLGDVENFEIRNDGVYADFKLNPAGKAMKESGTIKGISVELGSLTNLVLGKIALLPTFQRQAIAGAEFKEEPFIMEFKNKEGGIGTMDEKKIREDERKKVEAEFKAVEEAREAEFKATEEAKEAEFKAKMEAEVAKVREELTAKSELETKKAEFKIMLTEKLPKIAASGYEFALNRATDINDEIFNTIDGLEKFNNGLLENKTEKIKNSEFKANEIEVELANSTLNFIKGVK